MSSTPLETAVFVMDPVESLDIAGDTTFVLMLEAQRRGIRVLEAHPDGLEVDGGRVQARVRPLTLRREPGNHFDAGETFCLDFDAEADLVLQRKDPPVDTAYVTATQILGLCRRALVLNRPAGILASNEKLYALGFADLMPPTRVTASIASLEAFLDDLGGEMIVKPLDGRGGEGIFHVHREDRNRGSILEQSTAFGSRPVMAQAYLEEVREGDKRILLADGEPLGCVLRVPAERDHRANFHVGGSAARASLDADDRRIIERLAPSLRRDGLFFVGIDVIGGRLTEVNVTSPTGVQEIDRLEDRCVEADLLDAMQAQVVAHRR